MMTPERYQEVGAIFDAAKKLKPEDRPSYLAKACEKQSQGHSSCGP